MNFDVMMVLDDDQAFKIIIIPLRSINASTLHCDNDVEVFNWIC